MAINQIPEIEIKKTDLLNTLGTLDRKVSLGKEPTETFFVVFYDDQDSFRIQLDRKVNGYSVRAEVNGLAADHLTKTHFESRTTIGKVLILATGSKPSSSHDDNAYVLGFFS